MTNPTDLMKEEVKSLQEQLDIDLKKVSLLQQEIKQIQEEANAIIKEKQTQINNLTQPILETQGSLKKINELLNKLEGKIEASIEN